VGCGQRIVSHRRRIVADGGRVVAIRWCVSCRSGVMWGYRPGVGHGLNVTGWRLRIMARGLCPVPVGYPWPYLCCSTGRWYPTGPRWTGLCDQ
jgi:hypothetical protein